MGPKSNTQQYDWLSAIRGCAHSALVQDTITVQERRYTRRSGKAYSQAIDIYIYSACDGTAQEGMERAPKAVDCLCTKILSRGEGKKELLGAASLEIGEVLPRQGPWQQAATRSVTATGRTFALEQSILSSPRKVDTSKSSTIRCRLLLSIPKC